MPAEPEVTGQLFFRDAATSNTIPDGVAGPGRKLMLVVGILAVPEDLDIKPEHQYVVLDLGAWPLLTVVPSTATDIADRARGRAAGDLLCEPIWRV